MPTHYQAASEPSHFAQRFGLACEPGGSIVRPGQQGLFVRRPRADDAARDALSRFQIAPGRWGLIPLFSKDGQDLDTHEARGETAFAERNFYQPWKRGHRCVILADALFQAGAGAGETVRVSRSDGHPLALAGLWNGWRSPAGECVESFALLTFGMPGNPEQRRTAILRDAWIDDWLHCPVEETAAYLRPYADDKLVRQVLPVDVAQLRAA
ncbi:SOS response-associated peptidase family protein [Variovorax saccharolyticus]|uniref:SOS response-associated peptidase family protein n=1 Tax=Variovorax saccharolyticus TaxID=3053516 RepID=UPI0025776DBA|nr:SOS response-associated peptidase family protein [Variovorax sp. J22R187]MDM0017465.1 SOS response-associated peptidase family protein [Variovorax sp. J22R187]